MLAVHPGLPIGLSLFAVACTSAPAVPVSTAPAVPALPSRAAFSEQVLDPLAAKFAGEIIDHAQAEARAQAVPPAQDWVGNLILSLPYLKNMAAAEERTRKQEGERRAAWLETRRLPVKRELLGIMESRIEPSGTGYAVCLGKKTLKYEAEGGQWRRLEDGPGNCPVKQLTTLTEEPTTVTK